MTTQLKMSEQLKLAFKKIDSKEKWTQGAYARNSERFHVNPSSSYAVCFCSVGALRAASSGADWPYETADYLGSFTPLETLPLFNDTHTYEEVVTLWQKAIKAAEAQGN
jgi:hypothetical protein